MSQFSIDCWQTTTGVPSKPLKSLSWAGMKPDFINKHVLQYARLSCYWGADVVLQHLHKLPSLDPSKWLCHKVGSIEVCIDVCRSPLISCTYLPHKVKGNCIWFILQGWLRRSRVTQNRLIIPMDKCSFSKCNSKHPELISKIMGLVSCLFHE